MSGAGEPLSGLEDTRQQGPCTLTDVVEASRCQALWQVCGVEERGQDGHGHVLLVAQDGFVLRTLPGVQEQLQAVRETSGLGGRPAPFSSPEDVSAHVWTPLAEALTSSGCGWERELSGPVWTEFPSWLWSPETQGNGHGLSILQMLIKPSGLFS